MGIARLTFLPSAGPAGTICSFVPFDRAGEIEHFCRQSEVIATYVSQAILPVRLTVYWRYGTGPAGKLAANTHTDGVPLVDLEILVQTPATAGALECLTYSELAADEVLFLAGTGGGARFVNLRRWTPPGTARVVFPRDREAARRTYAACDDAAPTLCAPLGVPPVVLWRLPGGKVSYVEMCHVEDSARLVLDVSGGLAASDVRRQQVGGRSPGADRKHPHGTASGRASRARSRETDRVTARYALFGQDLEKGVILRGRVRGAWVPRQHDLRLARRLLSAFLSEPPPLTA